MRNKILFAVTAFVLTLSILGLASAVDVTLTVNTYANHDVSANVINPSTEETVHSSVQNSGEKGKAIFSFETSAPKIDISVIVRKNGKIIVFKKLESQTPSSSISMTALKEEPAPAAPPAPANTTEINDSAVNETETPVENVTANVTSETIPEQTGNETQEAASPPAEHSLLNIVLYIIGGIVVIFIIAGIVLFFVFRGKVQPKDIKVKKYSEMKKEEETKKEVPETEEDKRLVELESKINVLKNEIEGIRDKKSKIREAEEKLKKDMEELEKLKKEAQ
jgi:hypothetical protein